MKYVYTCMWVGRGWVPGLPSPSACTPCSSPAPGPSHGWALGRCTARSLSCLTCFNRPELVVNSASRLGPAFSRNTANSCLLVVHYSLIGSLLYVWPVVG